MPNFCAIDFGTTNSAIALPDKETMRLVEIEPGYSTIPTAVFYHAEDNSRSFGRAAIAEYIDGFDGRLMRSIKSILGSDLIEHETEVGPGTYVRYLDVVVAFLRHLKAVAEAQRGSPLDQVVLGRPVFFVDNDPIRDAKAQAALEFAARAVGFTNVVFQYEPIAAALDFEATTVSEELVLVIDVGGGTSDFSLVRVGPQHRDRLERKSDILASHGVHTAGTDFDRRVELASVLHELGYKTKGANGQEVPAATYFDLATWHLINTLYNPVRVNELRLMRYFYADEMYHRRLMKVVTEKLGHELAARTETAKIAVAAGGETMIDLGCIEAGLIHTFNEKQLVTAVEEEVRRIVAAALETVRLSGVAVERINALYFTGGSTGLRFLSDRLTACFPAARSVRGDRFASVATGLGLHASRLYGKISSPA
ncbi:MAG: Hsp70 family protein [Pseudomonadota bacterium]